MFDQHRQDNLDSSTEKQEKVQAGSSEVPRIERIIEEASAAPRHSLESFQFSPQRPDRPGPADGGRKAEGEPTALGVSNEKIDHKFFDSFQISKEFLKDGTPVPHPFMAFRSAPAILYGTASASAVIEELGPVAENYAPILLGNERVPVALWFVEYEHTNSHHFIERENPGSYKEVILNVALTEKGKERNLKGASAYSCLLPWLDSETRPFVGPLALTEDLPIKYGNEILGFRKEEAEISISRSGKRWEHSMKQGGNTLIEAGFSPRSGIGQFIASQLDVVKAFVQNYGLWNGIKRLSLLLYQQTFELPMELDAVSRTLEENSQNVRITAKLYPKLNAFSVKKGDSISVAPGSRVSDALDRFQCEWSVIAVDDNFRAVFE